MSGSVGPTKPQWWWRNRNIFIVGISGNIGVGKTTLIERLIKYKSLRDELDRVLVANNHKDDKVVVEFMLEPVELWKKKGYLQKFYDNPDINALAFQNIVFDTHVDAVSKILKKYYSKPDTTLVLVVERTMFDQKLFWKTQEDMGRECFTELSDIAYDMIWKRRDDYIPRVSLIFYLGMDNVNDTMKRIKRRARGEETPLEVRKDVLLEPKSMKMSWDPQEGDLDFTDSQSPSPPPPSPSISDDDNNNNERKKKNGGGVTKEYLQALENKHQAWYTLPFAFPPDCRRQKGIPCTKLNAASPYHESEWHLREIALIMAKAIYERVLINGKK